jgi:hypothetical protein
MDLIRKILSVAEEKRGIVSSTQQLEVDGYSSDDVAEHMMMLVDAGLIEAFQRVRSQRNNKFSKSRTSRSSSERMLNSNGHASGRGNALARFNCPLTQNTSQVLGEDDAE